MNDDSSSSASNTSNNAELSALLAVGRVRRRLLQAGLGCWAMPFFSLPAWATATNRPVIAFKPVSVSMEDAVRVPAAYAVQLLYAWGDPVSAGPAFKADASNSAAEQAEQAGMHHDGMHFFPFVEDG